MMNLKLARLLVVYLASGIVATVSAAEAVPSTQAQDTIDLFRKSDSSLEKFFTNSIGYAVFPKVGKGAVGIGGAHGKGFVYEKSRLIGEASLTQVTVGFQLGGQTYSELIFFETQDALDAFKQNKFSISAQVSAVAAAEGASANAKYQQGVAVFTLARTGFMYEASIGGQKFKFKPITNK